MNSITQITQNPIYTRLAIAAITLIVFIIAKRFLIKFVLKLISKVKIKDKQLDISLFDPLHKPLNYLILFTGFYLALVISPFTYSSPANISSLEIGTLIIPISVIPYSVVSKLYLAIVIGLLTRIIYDLEIIYEHIFSQFNMRVALIDNTLIIRYISRIIRFMTATLGVMSVLLILIPQLSSIITGVGVGGAALAIIFKDTIADIFSGMILLLDKPFVIGEWITIGDLEGIVEDISFRSTRIRTFTQGQVVMPNSTVGGSNIVNWSAMTKRRVKFNIGVTYSTTTEQIEKLNADIKAYLSAQKDVESGSYVIAFDSFGNHSLNIDIMYFTFKTDYAGYMTVKERINLELIHMCKNLGVEMAFPTHTVLLENTNS